MKDDKKKTENRTVCILYIIASICFFISAVLGFIDGSHTAVTQLCLGACFLCLSSVHYKKYKDENKEDSEQKK